MLRRLAQATVNLGNDIRPSHRLLAMVLRPEILDLHPPSLELLFGVAANHWNRGIATESSRCVIRYGFEELGFRGVEASTDRANTASVRVLEKLGMLFHRNELVDELDTVFYKLARNDWDETR